MTTARPMPSFGPSQAVQVFAKRPKFRANITYGNQGILTPTAGIKIPRNVTRPPLPDFKTKEFIVSESAKYKFVGAGADSWVTAKAGLTVTDFSLTIPQDCFREAPGQAGFLQFVGGEFIMNARITVYIDDRLAKRPSPFGNYDDTVSHEYLHVSDEIDILTNYMPREALRGEEGSALALRQLFLTDDDRQAVISRETYKLWFEKSAADCLGNKRLNIDLEVFNIYVDESNRRTAKLDRSNH